MTAGRSASCGGRSGSIVSGAERLLSEVVQTSPDAFVVLDDESRIQWWNRAAEGLFGWTTEEAVGRSLVDLVVPEHLGDAHMHGLRRRAGGGCPRLGDDPVQVDAVCRDGRSIQVELRVGELEWEGRRHFHAFLRDVTERERERQALKTAAEQLVDLNERLRCVNNELESINSDLDRFAAIVAHDLQNPLAVVSMSTELLSDALREASSVEQRAVQAISRSAKRMRLMINDLLAYSRASATELPREWVELEQMVEDVAAEIETSSDDPFRVTREVLPALPVDPGLFRHVIANVMWNAITYVAPGVQPHVHITSHYHSDSVTWTVRVADNGIGIADEEKEQVFAMFHRAASPEYPGSGIGLSTCRRIVERHGGRIWVEDNHGGGSVVLIAVPAPTTRVAWPESWRLRSES